MNDERVEEWVQQATAGDADALQLLLVHYHHQLATLVAGRIEPDVRALVEPEDVLQQAYAAAFAGVARCRFDGAGGFYKWLETIVLARLADLRRRLRSQKRDVRRHVPQQTLAQSTYDLFGTVTAGDTTPSRAVVRNEAVAAVLSSLARLSEDRREVIRLRFLEGRSVAEVAERLGKSEGAVHQLCSRGLSDLRRHLEPLTARLSRGE